MRNSHVFPTNIKAIDFGCHLRLSLNIIFTGLVIKVQ